MLLRVAERRQKRARRFNHRLQRDTGFLYREKARQDDAVGGDTAEFIGKLLLRARHDTLQTLWVSIGHLMRRQMHALTKRRALVVRMRVVVIVVVRVAVIVRVRVRVRVAGAVGMAFPHPAFCRKARGLSRRAQQVLAKCTGFATAEDHGDEGFASAPATGGFWVRF